ncbi:O-methyltransferase [Nocardia amamiensis]|uniref:O-methyltransferase n=1 Tax=Nocardia amamiensis TaxID=404578 RepID=A0ABS0CR34_9NOCA|nr:O-methyltransferase [Nocardia amamiensis]MBF6299080.1 O-methyltransferase [Nocardia amamiensis]
MTEANTTAASSADKYFRAVHGRREPMLDSILRQSLIEHDLRPMQVDDQAGRLLQLLTLIRRPQRVLEVGTFVGYSAIHIARGLPEGGRLISLERDSSLVAVAMTNIAAAGVADRVEVVEADAETYLRGIEPKSFDMVFIDAEKKTYPQYLKLCYPLLANDGLLVADDALAIGDFSGEPDGDAAGAVHAIDTYNRAVARSEQLFSALIPTKNGLMVSHKR